MIVPSPGSISGGLSIDCCLVGVCVGTSITGTSGPPSSGGPHGPVAGAAQPDIAVQPASASPSRTIALGDCKQSNRK
jgi:hypothetical protein